MIEEVPVSDGQWEPVPRAAQLLGLSESTLRRRIRDGRYQTRQEPYQGLEVHIPSANVGDSHRTPPLIITDVQARSVDVGDSHRQENSPPDLIGYALDALRMIAESERERSAAPEQRASQAEQAAAMWQERARNLEVQVEQLLALPAHEDPAEPHRWWQWWCRVRATGR